jgi:hypothetical protein
MDETRDTELGRGLEVLREPEHGPGYWRDMRLHVAEAAAEARRPSLVRRLRAALAPRPLRLALLVAAVAAVAAVALLAGLPRSSGPQGVSAAEVLDRALAAYSSGRTWQADLAVKYYASDMWDPPRWDVAHLRVVRDAQGSYRLTWYDETAAGRRVTAVEVYDATVGRQVRLRRPGRSWHVLTGYPLGPPDVGPAALDWGATMRAVAAAGNVRLGETVIDGRPAWTATCTKGEMAGLPPSKVDWLVYTIAVDKETWLPVRVREVAAGILRTDYRFRDLRVDSPLPPRVFSPPSSRGLTVKRSDLGFRRVTLDQARDTPGVTALVPGVVPDGYELSGVVVAPRAWTANHVVRARNVFALQYVSGFDALTVSTRTIADEYYTADDDPFDHRADRAWSRVARKEVAIASGAFAGAKARILVATTTSTPHLWAVKDGVLLTIGGGATAEELLAIAESLQAYPGASSSPTE